MQTTLSPPGSSNREESDVIVTHIPDAFSEGRILALSERMVRQRPAFESALQLWLRERPRSRRRVLFS